MQHAYDVLIDASRDDCPIPTIRAKEALDGMMRNQVLKLIASQEGTIRNIRTLVRHHQCELIAELREHDGFVFFIKK